MMTLVLMTATAVGGCRDTDVLVPWVSFRCQDRKRWTDFSPAEAPLPMTSEVRTFSFTHHLRRIFSDHQLPLCCPHVFHLVCSVVIYASVQQTMLF